MILKTCTQCGSSKSLTEFYVVASRPLPACKVCRCAKQREYVKNNPDKALEAVRAWRRKYPDRVRAADQRKREAKPELYREIDARKRARRPQHYSDLKRRYKAANPDKVKVSGRKYYIKNRERALAATLLWAKNNRYRMRAIRALCRVRKMEIRAMPAWADQDKMLEFYKQAVRLTVETGILHHVDHIVPLNGKTVCGLHCHFNLQVLTAAENVSKGNKRWPDMPVAA